MNFLGNYFGKKEEIIIEPKFKNMSKEELILTANTLKDANTNLKTSLNELTSKNNNLKETILDKKKKSSEIKNFVKDMKYTLFSSGDIDNNEKNKELNDFIYDQYFLYGGLEEEEINDLNQIKMKEDNWADNKDFFILKQKIIERNYQELFKNIYISKELNKLFSFKEKENENNNNIKEEIKLNEHNFKNKENKEEKTVKKEIKKHKIKKENKKKEKIEKEKKEEKNTFDIDKLDSNKDKKINYKLEDFNFLDDKKESLSLNQLSDEKNKKWDDDDED